MNSDEIELWRWNSVRISRQRLLRYVEERGVMGESMLSCSFQWQTNPVNYIIRGIEIYLCLPGFGGQACAY